MNEKKNTADAAGKSEETAKEIPVADKKDVATALKAVGVKIIGRQNVSEKDVLSFTISENGRVSVVTCDGRRHNVSLKK
jgi:hypothetical protein|nr:MAG TPA: hypothetical protein [Caudoviricetes sp.]